MHTTLENPTPFLAAYQQAGLAARGPGWLRELREQAMEHYAATGFPGTKDPAWSHTDLRALASVPYRPAPPGLRVDAAAVEAHHFPGEGPRLVFADGRLDTALSHIEDLPAGVELGGLADAFRRADDGLEDNLGRHADPDRPFTALNLGFLEDGAFLRLAPGAAAPQPIHLVWISTGGHSEPTMTHPRLLVLAGAGSQVTLLETYTTLGTAPTWTNAVAEVVAHPEAVVRHIRVQRESLNAAHFHSLHVRAHRQSRVESFLFSLGGGLVRNEVDVQLDAEGAETSVDGLFLGTSRQSVDNRTRIGHNRPRTTSRQLYKGILDGAARGAFTGSVVVEADAQKTLAEQTNRNLLLSRKALVDSVPALEIHADDVKCSHGSTIGRLDEVALFFLRSRGIGPEVARLILTQAFAREALDRVAHGGIRSLLDGLLRSWFAGRKDMEVPE